jgi:hypothetical protein
MPARQDGIVRSFLRKRVGSIWQGFYRQNNIFAKAFNREELPFYWG